MGRAGIAGETPASSRHDAWGMRRDACGINPIGHMGRIGPIHAQRLMPRWLAMRLKTGGQAGPWDRGRLARIIQHSILYKLKPWATSLSPLRACKEGKFEDAGETPAIPGGAVHTSHFALHTSHFTLHTSHFALHTSHFACAPLPRVPTVEIVG